MEFYGEERATDIRDFVSEHGFMVLKNAISNHDAARLHDLFGECFEAQSMQHKDSLNSRILPEPVTSSHQWRQSLRRKKSFNVFV